jgi:DNA-binding CsgD family transcriptional regulator
MVNDDLTKTATIASLSDRERTVLRLVQRGFQTDEIARELDRSPNTIENQIASARRKLGGVTRRQAARLLAEAEFPANAAFDAATQDSGSPTNRPFAIPESAAAVDRSERAAEMVREERAIFLTEPAGMRDIGREGASRPYHPTTPNHLATIALIVAITIGIVIILAATPVLVESFKTFTGWIIQTFY